MKKYLAPILLTAFLSPNAFAGSDGAYFENVIASFDRMLNHQPVAAVKNAAGDRDALQEAFAARLWTRGDARAWGTPGNATTHRTSGEWTVGARAINGANGSSNSGIEHWEIMRTGR